MLLVLPFAAQCAEVPQVGQTAPDFSLPSQEGGKVSLKDFKGKWVVLYFYPKDDTSGCTAQACGFRDNYPVIEEKNAVVLGVSKDSIASHCKFRDKYDLNFPLLSDPDGKVLEKYGAWGEKNMYGKKSMGIIRSTVLIDPAGKVAHHWAKVKAAGHAEAVRAKIAELRG